MASPTYSRPLVALLVSVLLLSGTSARGGGGGGRNSGGDDDTSASDGCCYGSNSKCASASESQCATYSKRLGCEWRAGADASCSDDDDDEPSDGNGCCVGSSSKCDGVDESKCSKLSRQGCEWTYTCDADDGGDDDAYEGCCLGDHAKCAVDDQASCDKVPAKFACQWATGDDCSPAPPTPEPTVEPGCCFGESASCDVDDEKTCTKNARRYGCEWRSGYGADCSAVVTPAPVTPAPVTPAPTAPTAKPTSAPTGCPTNHRHRHAWGELSDAERQLYIDGYLKLSKKGLTQRATQAHLESSEHTVPEFLPWHREFIYQMENNIRALGDEFECFTLPYWDWTDEPTPYDVEVFGEELFVLNSGLGGDGQGECMADDVEVWGKGNGYSPSESFAEDFPDNLGFDDCLLRDVDYVDNVQCAFFSAAQMMELITMPMYGIFRPWLEGIPHALPHACFGGEKFGHMATIYSPDDPLFYLLHGFVDYQWALWQDCNGYDNVGAQSYNDLMYDDDVNQMLDFYPMINFEYPLSVASTLDLANYDVSYSKGRFWEAAHVDDTCADIAWFYDDEALSAEVGNQQKERTPSQKMQEAMYQTVQEQYSGATQQAKVHTWAVGECNVAHFDAAAVEGAEVCVGGAHVDAARCDEFPRDPDTGDIIASLEELTEGLPQCLADQRAGWFEFIEVNHWHSLYELCQGCLDDVCDRSELLGSDDKCMFNRKVSVQRVRAREGIHGKVFSALVSARAISVDTLGLMGMAGMVVAGLGMALKRMCEGKEGKEEMDRAAYGSMQ